MSQTNAPELIVMLTHNDLTVQNAGEVFEECKDSKARYWGFKEQPLPRKQMKELFSRMRECGKTTCLEVVAYTEEEGLEGARTAFECGCDILMGTHFFDSILEFCQTHGLKYMPFVGTVTGRPSVLEGNIEDIIHEAQEYILKGAHGIDLLGFRYTGDASQLIQTLIQQVHVPVCLAGSIDTFPELDIVKHVAPWGFTIGSAFFENKFGDSFPDQINRVCDYVEGTDVVVDYYDSIAKTYDESRFHNSYGQFIDYQERKVLDQLIETSGDKLLLDMACGTGRLSNYATHGLDASAEMLKIAQRHHENIEFCHASACETGYPDGMFDTVFAFHFLMHLDEAVVLQVFNETYRILKKGGRFIFDIPSKKRRRLVHYKQETWHGGTEFSSEDIAKMIKGRYKLQQCFGIMMAPVHKLPVKLRKPLQKVDFALANSCLKEYSSYLVFEIVKQ